MNKIKGYCQTCHVVKEGKITNEHYPMQRISDKNDDPVFYCKICNGVWLYDTTWNQYCYLFDANTLFHIKNTKIFEELEKKKKHWIDKQYKGHDYSSGKCLTIVKDRSFYFVDLKDINNLKSKYLGSPPEEETALSRRKGEDR